jgi:tRNA threonylcarbamoyladenosine biosynthesis protein TsaE
MNGDYQLALDDEAATETLGARLAQHLRDGLVIYLTGDLGAGKTTLVRGLLRHLGHTGAVKSPTYTLLEEYRLGGRSLYHFDLYRLHDPEELELIGIRDYADGRAIFLIEWPERGQGWLPQPDLVVKLEQEQQGRTASLRAASEAGGLLLAALAGGVGTT